MTERKSIFVACDCAGKPIAAFLTREKAEARSVPCWGSVKEVKEEAWNDGCRSESAYYPYHEEHTGKGTCGRCGVIMDAELVVRTMSAANILARNAR